MLRFDKTQTIEGVTVYGDDEQDNLFYILPDAPRFRLDENGKPVFKFLKYRTPIERQNGKKGGYCNFDVEFVVSAEKEKKIVAALKAQRRGEVQIGKLSYTEGKAELLIKDGKAKDGTAQGGTAQGGTARSGTSQDETTQDGLVERVLNPAAPSLFGKNITPFSIELSQDGAAIFEKALQGLGGFVQVAYSLTTWARLQGATVKFKIDSETKHTFYDKVTQTDGHDIWREGKYEEKLEDIINRNENSFIEFKWGDIPDDQKEKIRTWAQGELARLVARKINIAKPTPDSDRSVRASGGAKRENVTDILQKEDFKIMQTYSEDTAIEWAISPSGTLPNITTLPGWVESDKTKYFDTIDADDPFFRTLAVQARVNADFTNLPIYNVTVLLDYDKPETLVFKTADELKTYKRFLIEGKPDYSYSYEVNYKNSSKTLRSETKRSAASALTINVDDLGLLAVDINADATLDFEKIAAATVFLSYEDKEHGVNRLERRFVLDSTNKAHKLREVLGVPRTQPYQYRVEYLMKASGRKYVKGGEPSDLPQLFIGSPFAEIKEYRVIGTGLAAIEQIYLDLKYEETGNAYSQATSLVLKQGTTVDPWKVPVIDPKMGKLSYGGTIVHKNGNTEEIPTKDHSVDRSAIVVGIPEKVQQEKLTITVHPDYIKWSGGPALVQVFLQYAGLDKTLSFKNGATQEQKWEVELKDPANKTFKWKAAFEFEEESRSTDWQTTTNPEVFIRVPAAAAKPEQAKLSVTVHADLIEWSDDLRLVQVSLTHPEGKKSLTFKKDGSQEQTWELVLKDPAKNAFEWSAKFLFKSGAREIGPHTTTDPEVFVDSEELGKGGSNAV